MGDHEFRLPDLGLTCEVRVTAWHVRQGNSLSAGDHLVEVTGEEVTMDLPAPRDGVLAEILATEDQVVQTGDLLAKIREADAEAADHVDEGT